MWRLRGQFLILLSILALGPDRPAHALDEMPTRPHILLLFAEDMSSHLGSFGDAVAMTPNLDRLAKEGVRFTRTFTAASTCGPSRASLLLGAHPISTGSQHMRTSSRPAGAYRSVPPADMKAFPELLRASGYYAFNQGKLDYQFSGIWAGTGPFTIWDTDEGSDRWHGRASDQPFFGMISFTVTHESASFPPLGSWPHSVTALVMQLVHAFGNYDVGVGPIEPDQVEIPPYYPDTPTVREDMSRHYNNIYQMDLAVGEILEALDAEGLLEDTVVIWTSDHGDGLPRAKRSLFDSGLRVPMIIRWPDRFRPEHLEPGEVDRRLISFVDLAPSILEMAGVTAPSTMQGRSFLDAKPGREAIFASQGRVDDRYDRQRALRTERYKYIRSEYPELPIGYPNAFRNNLPMMRELLRLYAEGQLTRPQRSWFEPIGREQLYDLDRDPEELTNLAALESYESQRAELSRRLDEWQSEMRDWSDEHEDEMVARFQDDGEARVTDPPELRVESGRIRITSTTKGASIGYQIDDGPWRLYTAPVPAASGSRVTAKAVRYGWDESEETSVRIP
jgi:N-sulfoglucosamine sulfohydrolase